MLKLSLFTHIFDNHIVDQNKLKKIERKASPTIDAVEHSTLEIYQCHNFMLNSTLIEQTQKTHQ